MHFTLPELKEKKMKKLALILPVLLFLMTLSASAQQRKGKQNPKTGRTLTLPIAQRTLSRLINETSVDNMILTCRACYSDEDKGENDNFAVVSTYPGINQFLRSQGYIRLNGKREEVLQPRLNEASTLKPMEMGMAVLAGPDFDSLTSRILGL